MSVAAEGRRGRRWLTPLMAERLALPVAWGILCIVFSILRPETFPTVDNGKGDPKDVVGNPSNFFSVTAKSAHVSGAIDYIEKTVTSPDYVSGLIKIGQVPAVAGLQSQLTAGPNADYTTFVYGMVQDAPSFTQSWDQALDPATSQKMLTNLQQVFNKQISPQQFVSARGS